MINNTTNPSVQSFYSFITTCSFVELQINITPSEDVYIDGWIGAALRNNLLHAAENINVIGAVSLRKIINILTIKQTNPLYDEMKGGFPKGYGITLHSHIENIFSCQLKKDEVVRFSILLYGHFSDYTTPFKNAVKKMCERGIGKPLTPFRLIDISIKPVITLSDYMDQKCNENERFLSIKYLTPTNLYNRYYNNTPGVYIDRQHEFPGFYQLVRSAAYRIAKLTALYTFPDDEELYTETEKRMDEFTQYAVTVLLSSAQLKRIKVESTAKKGTADRIQFSGYTGEVCFEGNFNYYLPLLLFTENIGAGNNLTYGLGRYQIVKH